MQKATLKCDNPDCDWNIEILFDDVPNWHRSSCPKCHDYMIVDNRDMVVWHQAKLALVLTDIIDPDKELPRHDVIVDTAGLRE